MWMQIEIKYFEVVTINKLFTDTIIIKEQMII